MREYLLSVGWLAVRLLSRVSVRCVAAAAAAAM